MTTQAQEVSDKIASNVNVEIEKLEYDKDAIFKAKYKELETNIKAAFNVNVEIGDLEQDEGIISIATFGVDLSEILTFIQKNTNINENEIEFFTFAELQAPFNFDGIGFIALKTETALALFKTALMRKLAGFPLDIRRWNNTLNSDERAKLELIEKIRSNHYKVNEHIPFLEIEIEDQLENIKNIGLRGRDGYKFMEFEREFKRRKETQKISYEWWIVFAFRLSILLTPEPDRTIAAVEEGNKFVLTLLDGNLWHNHDDVLRSMTNNNNARPLRELIQMFPDVIMIPVVMTRLTVHFLNRLLAYNAMPLTVTNSIRTIMGDDYLSPNNLFNYDISHADNYFHYIKTNETIKEFISYILKAIDKENDNIKKSQLELMLFYMWHVDVQSLQKIKFNGKKIDLIEKTLFGHLKFHQSFSSDNLFLPTIKSVFGKSDVSDQEVVNYADESLELMEQYVTEFFNEEFLNNNNANGNTPKKNNAPKKDNAFGGSYPHVALFNNSGIAHENDDLNVKLVI